MRFIWFAVRLLYCHHDRINRILCIGRDGIFDTGRTSADLIMSETLAVGYTFDCCLQASRSNYSSSLACIAFEGGMPAGLITDYAFFRRKLAGFLSASATDAAMLRYSSRDVRPTTRCTCHAILSGGARQSEGTKRILRRRYDCCGYSIVAIVVSRLDYVR